GNVAVRRGFDAVFLMVLAQIALGIVTVIYAAPANIAIVHQFGAIGLWVLILRARFRANFPPPQSLRGAPA
ncbi:MAG: COX15/CtaA family protein, partial [Paracoccaceae bacterium]